MIAYQAIWRTPTILSNAYKKSSNLLFEYSITGGLDRCDTPCYWALTLFINNSIFTNEDLRLEYTYPARKSFLLK